MEQSNLSVQSRSEAANIEEGFDKEKMQEPIS